MNGSSFPATMERKGGSGCGNQVTLASCRCMAEPSRTQLLYAQGVWMRGCSGQGMGGSRRRSERFSLPLPAHLKDAERVPGAAVPEITLPPPPRFCLRPPSCSPWGALPGLGEMLPCLAFRSCQHRPPNPAPAPGLPSGSRDRGGPAPFRASLRNQGGEVIFSELLFSSLGHPLPFLRTRKEWGSGGEGTEIAFIRASRAESQL